MAQNTKQPGKKKKINLYTIFNPEGNGKGLTKEEARAPRDFAHFFKFVKTNLSLLFSLNLLMVIGNFPLLIALYGLTGNLNTHTSSAASMLFAPLYAAMTMGQKSPVIAALYGVHGVQTAISIQTTATTVLFALGGLVIFTFGAVNVGTTYIMRNVVKGEPTFFFQDFCYAIKKNWKQAVPFGIADAVLLGMMLFDVMFFYMNTGTVLTNIFFCMMVVIFLLYIMMRFYIYIMMVTFDLSLPKLLKNAIIFSLLGIKRNLMALLGIVVLVILNIALFLIFMPLGIIAPFIITLSLGAFMAAYAAYPKIKEIMIDPYYASDRVGGEAPDESEEPIFTDRG